MLKIKSFGEQLVSHGYNFYCGVPCSFLKGILGYAMRYAAYIAATDEGTAVAVGAGAFLGGNKPVVLMQNSGLANAISPLTSLLHTFQIPILGFVSLRGGPGFTDEPQHELMGRITTDMLDLMELTWEYLADNLDETACQLDRADLAIRSGRSYFFVVKKGILYGELEAGYLQPAAGRNLIKSNQIHANQAPTRYQALTVINTFKDCATVQLATTGKTGRELSEIEDSPNNLYMVGSMGCISSLGLGLALARPDKDVVVLDGDGSLLMKMGNMALSGYYGPDNFFHILLDNYAYESTGGQPTVSSNVDFVQIAASCGYTRTIHVHNLDELRQWMIRWKQEKGLTFLRLPIATEAKQNLGRPKIKPCKVKERVVRFIHG